MANDVWVYIEHKEGAISPMSFELLGIGKELAAGFGSNLCAFVIGAGVDDLAKEAGAYGAAKVYAVEGDVFKDFRGEAYAKAAAFLLDKYKPEVALFRATTMGTDVAAAAAAPASRARPSRRSGRIARASGCGFRAASPSPASPSWSGWRRPAWSAGAARPGARCSWP